MQNHTTAAPFHFGNRQPRNKERAFQIYVERPVPIVFRDIRDAAIGTHSATVDYDIDAA